jgi:hypothetical protein
MTTTEPTDATDVAGPTEVVARRPWRPRRWMFAVSALLVAWLGAQVIAGWKFANGTTYPVVGSAMFNGPPNGAGRDFMVPRVYVITASGQRIEMDQHTFGLEPFEWRRWVKRHLEDVDDAHAKRYAEQLAVVFSDARPDAASPVTIELWRVPAVDERLDHGRMIRTVTL